MSRIIPYENLENRYEDLAKAVIIQAADDYKRYRFVLDTIDLRKYKNEEGKLLAIDRAKKRGSKGRGIFRN